jgi:S1-C subfamily serine protease
MIAAALAAGLVGGVAGGIVVDVARDNGSPEPTAGPTATATPLATAGVVLDALQQAIERVLPAVVTVLADQPQVVDEDGNVSQERDVGSGVVIDANGHVITNAHVVDGAVEIAVILATGEVRAATLVASDSPYSDLAVLQVAPAGLRAMPFGDSSALRPGQRVAAIVGAAITGANSVKVGVVSGTGRSWPRNGVLLEDLVQSDVAVNNGDSGGALVNDAGELVGIVTTVVRENPAGGIIEGVAFAQSSDSLRPIVERIAATGSFPRPRLGIEHPLRQHIELTPQLSAAQGIAIPLGALVVDVESGSPADDAGIEPGDIVVAVNEVPVDLDRPFVNLLKALSPGDTAELVVVREGQQLVIAVSPRYEE